MDSQAANEKTQQKHSEGREHAGEDDGQQAEVQRPVKMGDDREVHPEVTGDEGEGKEYRCHDRQPVDDLTLTFRGGRAEGLHSVTRLVAAVVRSVEEGHDVAPMGIEVLRVPACIPGSRSTSLRMLTRSRR